MVNELVLCVQVCNDTGIMNGWLSDDVCVYIRMFIYHESSCSLIGFVKHNNNAVLPCCISIECLVESAHVTLEGMLG